MTMRNGNLKNMVNEKNIKFIRWNTVKLTKGRSRPRAATSVHNRTPEQPHKCWQRILHVPQGERALVQTYSTVSYDRALKICYNNKRPKCSSSRFWDKERQRGEAWQCFWCAGLPQGSSRDQISTKYRKEPLRWATAMRINREVLHIKVGTTLPVRSYEKIILHTTAKI